MNTKDNFPLSFNLEHLTSAFSVKDERTVQSSSGGPLVLHPEFRRCQQSTHQPTGLFTAPVKT